MVVFQVFIKLLFFVRHWFADGSFAESEEAAMAAHLVLEG
jgi:hypothetical protein